MSDQEHNNPETGKPVDPWLKEKAAESTHETASAVRAPAEKGNETGWERDLVNRLAFAALNEQRRARRWSIFFKFLIFAYLFTLLFYLPGEWGATPITPGKHTAIIDIDGEIASDSVANADAIVGGLRSAFEDKRTAGIILRLNTPGGSPVQAGYVYDEIKRLRRLNPNVPVYAVVTDVCASGGYYIAAAADKIFADKASMVGSIGVLMDGFGFTGTMEKLGVERRLLTAGESKGFLDPFSPVKEGDVAHVRGMLENIHNQFKTAVKDGRGNRLKDDPTIFSGLVWTGEQAVELGLVDNLGNSSYVAREVIGVEDIVDFTQRPNYLDRFAERLGVVIADNLAPKMSLR